MVDAQATDYAYEPRIRKAAEQAHLTNVDAGHNCLTCYLLAVEAASAGRDNIYADELYYVRGGPAPQPTPLRGELGQAFRVDLYQYSPPFLILPWALEKLGGGFFGARSLFFFVTLGAFLGCLFRLWRWLAKIGAPDQAWRAWIALPLLLLAGTTASAFQVGNAHILVIAMAILGMIAAAENRTRTAGALLGFAAVAKLFPVMLLVFLFARGKRRTVAWSLGFVAVYALVALLLFGFDPFADFFSYQLPRIASGDAFPFGFSRPKADMLNISVMNLPFRLAHHLPFDNPMPFAKVLIWVYGLAVLGLAYWTGHRTRSAASARLAAFTEPAIWLAILVLAQACTPFVPWYYGNFVIMWLIAIWLAAVRSRLAAAALLAAWAVLAVHLPFPYGPSDLTLDWLVAHVAVIGSLAFAVVTLVLLARRQRPVGLAPADVAA